MNNISKLRKHLEQVYRDGVHRGANYHGIANDMLNNSVDECIAKIINEVNK